MGHVDSKAKFTRFRLFWAGSDHEATPKRPRSDHKATPERRGALPAPGRAGRHVRVVKSGVINQCRSDEILFWKRYVSKQSWPALRTKKGWRMSGAPAPVVFPSRDPKAMRSRQTAPGDQPCSFIAVSAMRRP
ncbi:MAG: hypothetical protein CMN60_18150 [Sphingobium sp.]|nr:hypothetical protein [Sphingobium sp.]